MEQNPILSRIIAHFDKQGTKYHDVPEWGEEGAPLRIFFTPMTLLDKQKVRDAGKRGGELNMLVETIILKAMDGAGKKLFSIAERKELQTRADTKVISRICDRISLFVGDADPEGEAEDDPLKN